MSISFDVGRRVALHVSGAAPEAEQRVIAAMDPCPPVDGVERAAGLTVECDADVGYCHELINPARDAITTGSAATAHVLVQPGVLVTLPGHNGPQATIRLGPGGSVTSIMRPIIRPALQVLMLDAGALAMHAACIAVDDGAIAVGGWSESGKTELALALLEHGGRFVSDKWTVIGDDGTAATFPIGVGVRRWVLDALPTLRAALPRNARARLKTAAAMDFLTRPLRHLGDGRLGRSIAASVERGVGVADRAGLTPSEVAAAYGHTLDPGAATPLKTVVLLSTVPGTDVTVSEVGPEWAARRLARTAQYERRGYFDLLDRARYGDAAPGPSLRHRVEEREEAMLRGVLDGVQLLKVGLPFPADPRPAAAAILEQVAA